MCRRRRRIVAGDIVLDNLAVHNNEPGGNPNPRVGPREIGAEPMVCGRAAVFSVYCQFRQAQQF